jgi:hypothetical protein
MGWHLIETLGTKVRRAKVTDNIIQREYPSFLLFSSFVFSYSNYWPTVLCVSNQLQGAIHVLFCLVLSSYTWPAEGSLSVIRVLPGQYGLGLINGHPVVLLPGRHLINDPMFTYRYAYHMIPLYMVQPGRIYGASA